MFDMAGHPLFDLALSYKLRNEKCRHIDSFRAGFQDGVTGGHRHLARLHLFPPRNHHSLRCSWLQLTIRPNFTSVILDRQSPAPHRRLQR